MSNNNQKFKLCLTLAGAVSAGAYTAGVMDYLLETLALWDQAQTKNKALGEDHPEYNFSIPMHEVELDVISGASAGGITGALSLLNLIDDNYSPVNKDNPVGKNNRFYQSWVEMDDDEQSNTFEKLLATADLKNLKKGETPKSLLNPNPIDNIAHKAIALENIGTYPNYVSSSMDLILTTTNLRGINFKIDFNSEDNGGSIITSHAGFFRYKLVNKQYKAGIPFGDEIYYVLDLSHPRDMNFLKEATLSTAAFPLGLPSREIMIPQVYIKRYPQYIFGNNTGIRPLLIENTPYKFNSIDGGLINNEPFAIALKVLKEKSAIPYIKEQYAVIMVDPFPNKDSKIEKENCPSDMLSVTKGMFKALRNQVMFNRDGILDAIALNNYTKFLIEPVRKTRVDGELIRAENDLATAPFSGFAGFIDKSFRQHDYQLGRQNCQAFLRYYFTIPENDIKKRLNQYPNPEAFERFYIHQQPSDNSSPKLFPIIPDLRVLHAKTCEADIENFGVDAHLDYPKYPAITEVHFNKKYKKLIQKRIELLSNTFVPHFWFSLANKLFLKNKLSKELETLLLDALKAAKLIKPNRSSPQ